MMCKMKMIQTSTFALPFVFLSANLAIADVVTVTIDGSDAIFLAGRTDVVIPPASDPWNTGTFLVRHVAPTPEEIQETLPPVIAVSAGDVIRALDPAVGGISFFNGFGGTIFGPGGNGLSGSNLTALDGISGYLGPQGPLAGVFLDDSIPNGSAPATLDFTIGGLGTEFMSLSPMLGQVFYIGDGKTTLGDFHTFIAPANATRLALGIPDGFGFVGAPGAYDDNDGRYQIRLGINEIPDIPVPAAIWLFGSGLLGLVGFGRASAKRMA